MYERWPRLLYPCCQVSLCQQCIDWAKGENRVFLRQALEARLIALHVDTHNYTAALSIGRREKYHSGVYCLYADVHLSSSYSSLALPPFLFLFLFLFHFHSPLSLLLSSFILLPFLSFLPLLPSSPSFLSFPPPLSFLSPPTSSLPSSAFFLPLAHRDRLTERTEENRWQSLTCGGGYEQNYQLKANIYSLPHHMLC